MSHMSYRGCKHCKLPEYACDCDEQDLDEQSPVQKILKGIEPWEEDYFFLRRALWLVAGSPKDYFDAWNRDSSGECQLRALVITIAVVVAAAGPAQARSLRVAGTAGYLSEWELNAKVTQTASGAVKEFSGPLTLKHVGLCSHNGPQEKSGEIKIQISESGPLSQIRATLLYEDARCTYSGQLSESSSGFMQCSNAEGVPVTLSVK